MKHKKRRKFPSGGRRRDTSLRNQQHTEDLNTLLKRFREAKLFRLKGSIFLPMIYISAKCLDINTNYLNSIIFLFFILLFLQLTTLILFELEKIKILLITLFPVKAQITHHHFSFFTFCSFISYLIFILGFIFCVKYF
jgi:hypothetical protein